MWGLHGGRCLQGKALHENNEEPAANEARSTRGLSDGVPASSPARGCHRLRPQTHQGRKPYDSRHVGGTTGGADISVLLRARTWRVTAQRLLSGSTRCLPGPSAAGRCDRKSVQDAWT
jgi:hypothetical protein